MKNNLFSIQNNIDYNDYTFNIFDNKKNFNKKNKNLNIGRTIEGLFINMILKNNNYSELFKNTIFNNEQEQMYTDIYHSTLSQNVSKKGFGLAEMIEKQINSLESLSLKNKKII